MAQRDMEKGIGRVAFDFTEETDPRLTVQLR